MKRLERPFQDIKSAQLNDLMLSNKPSQNLTEKSQFIDYYKSQDDYGNYVERINALTSYDSFKDFIFNGKIGFKISAFTHYLVKKCIEDIDSQNSVEYFTHDDILHFLNGSDTCHTFNKAWGNNIDNFYIKACITIQNMIDSVHYIDNEPYVSIPAKLIKQILGSAQRGYAFDKNLVLSSLRHIGYIDEKVLINNNGTHYHLTNKYNSKLTHKAWMIFSPIVSRWNHHLLKSVTDDELYNIYGLMTFEPCNEDYFDALKFIDQYNKGEVEPKLSEKFSNSYYQAQLTIAFKEKDFMMLSHHKTSKKCGRRFTQLTSYKSSLRKRMYNTKGIPTVEVDLTASQASQLYNMMQLAKLNHENTAARFIRKVMLNYYLKNGMNDTLVYMMNIHNRINAARFHTLEVDENLNENEVKKAFHSLAELRQRSYSMGHTNKQIHLKGSMNFNAHKYFYKDTEFVDLDKINYLELCDYFINTCKQIDNKEWRYMEDRYKKYRNEFTAKVNNVINLNVDSQCFAMGLDLKLVAKLDEFVHQYTIARYGKILDCKNTLQELSTTKQTLPNRLEIKERMLKLRQIRLDKQRELDLLDCNDYNNARQIQIINTSLSMIDEQLEKGRNLLEQWDVIDDNLESYDSMLNLNEVKMLELAKTKLEDRYKIYMGYSDEALIKCIEIGNQRIATTTDQGMINIINQQLADIKDVIKCRKEVKELTEKIKQIREEPVKGKEIYSAHLRMRSIMVELTNEFDISFNKTIGQIASRCDKIRKFPTVEFKKIVSATYDSTYVGGNDFYYHLYDRAWDHTPVFLNNPKSWDRDMVKKLFCRVVYGNKYMYENNRDDNFNRITKALKSIDKGGLLKLINTYKYNDWNLAVDVMKTETYFMNLVWTRLKNMGIKFSSIHDSIKVPLQHATQVDEVINDIANILGFSYFAKYEY